MTTASSMSPNCWKYCRKPSSVVWYGRPPTKIFVNVVSIGSMLVARWLLVIWSLAVMVNFFFSSLFLFDDFPASRCRRPSTSAATVIATSDTRQTQTAQHNATVLDLRVLVSRPVWPSTHCARLPSSRLARARVRSSCQCGYRPSVPLTDRWALLLRSPRSWTPTERRRHCSAVERTEAEGLIERRGRLLTLTGGPTINQNDARVLSTPSAAPAVRGSGHLHPRTVPLTTTKTLLTLSLTTKRTLTVKWYHWQVFRVYIVVAMGKHPNDASRGKVRIAQWALSKRRISVNIKQRESRSSARRRLLLCEKQYTTGCFRLWQTRLRHRCLMFHHKEMLSQALTFSRRR